MPANPYALSDRFLQCPCGASEVRFDLLGSHPLRFLSHFLFDGVQDIEIVIKGLVLCFHCSNSNGVWINNTWSYPARRFTALKSVLLRSFARCRWFQLTTSSRPATVAM